MARFVAAARVRYYFAPRATPLKRRPLGGANMLRTTSSAVVWCFLALACHESPTEPTATPLRAGRWAGNDVEIQVADDHFDFTTTRCVRGFMNRPLIDLHGNFT